jgi:hypothetical protein
MKKIWMCLLTCMPLIALAQGIAINNDGSQPDSSALLDIKSTTKGLLIPRMTSAERMAIAMPAIGLTVFDMTTTSYWMYRGDVNGGWTELQHQYQNYWSQSGGNIHFNLSGNVGIGTNIPGEKLSLNGVNAAIQFMNSGTARGFLQTSGSDMRLATYANNTIGNIIFNTKAVDRMWIDENGLVGIGTSSPSAALTVNGADPLLQMRTGNINRGYLQAFGADLRVGTNNTNTNGHLVLQTRAIDRMHIDENGLVGIGTTTPSAVLTVNANNPIFQMRNANVDKGFIQLVDDDIKIGTNITNGSGKFVIRTNGADRLTVDGNGRVGIGVSGSLYPLKVNGECFFDGDVTMTGQAKSASYLIRSANPEIEFEETDMSLNAGAKIQLESGVFKIGKGSNGGSIVIDANQVSGTKRFYLSKANQFNFGTGIFAFGYTLSVEGKVIATDFTTQSIGTWPDYVFAPGYQLRPLSELRNFIKTNQHLPNIPPAAEIEKNGVQLGDMSKKLMEKVEELTLYILQLEERLAKLETKR